MKNNLPIVWLDAGHGGHDSGALSPQGLRESDVVLAVCLRAEKMLEGYPVRVATTRRSDVFETLTRRAQLANNAGADIFISVHCNSAEYPVSGIETFSTGSTKGSKLAGIIQDELLDAFPDSTDRGTKVKGYSVLRKTKMPAALTELEFIHTLEGEALFTLDENLTKYASCIANAALANFGIATAVADVPAQVVPRSPNTERIVEGLLTSAKQLEFQAKELRKHAELLTEGSIR